MIEGEQHERDHAVGHQNREDDPSSETARIVAHAADVRIDAERAEVAFLVADHWQGRGISTIALAHLAVIADEKGIAWFTAEVLPANQRMIEVFRQSGFPLESGSTPDALEIEFPTSLSPVASERFEERERVAAVAAVKRFLEPESVAVVGASRLRGTIGGEILHNLITSGFTGAVYAVNEEAKVAQSLPAYRSVAEIPGAVDLVVVAVPAAQVLDIARQCGGAAHGPGGVELIVGVVHDHSFGPVLVCGGGGTTAELIKEVTVRITPITNLEAREMLRALRTFPLLDGYRGAVRCDLAAIEDVLIRVSAMVEASDALSEPATRRTGLRRLISGRQLVAGAMEAVRIVTEEFRLSGHRSIAGTGLTPYDNRLIDADHLTAVTAARESLESHLLAHSQKKMPDLAAAAIGDRPQPPGVNNGCPDLSRTLTAPLSDSTARVPDEPSPDPRAPVSPAS